MGGEQRRKDEIPQQRGKRGKNQVGFKGGQGVRPPENHKLYEVLMGISNWTPSLEKVGSPHTWKKLDPLRNFEK